MHAIGSGIMGDSEYLNETSALNTKYNLIIYLQCQHTQIRYFLFSQYILYYIIKNKIMGDWESLQVLALGYDSLI